MIFLHGGLPIEFFYFILKWILGISLLISIIIFIWIQKRSKNQIDEEKRGVGDKIATYVLIFLGTILAIAFFAFVLFSI